MIRNKKGLAQYLVIIMFIVGIIILFKFAGTGSQIQNYIPIKDNSGKELPITTTNFNWNGHPVTFQSQVIGTATSSASQSVCDTAGASVTNNYKIDGLLIPKGNNQ